MCGGGTMYPITMNFAEVNEFPIVIIYTKFGEDRSISLVSAGSRISPLCLHLTTGHYNIACTTVQLVITPLSLLPTLLLTLRQFFQLLKMER